MQEQVLIANHAGLVNSNEMQDGATEILQDEVDNKKDEAEEKAIEKAGGGSSEIEGDDSGLAERQGAMASAGKNMKPKLSMKKPKLGGLFKITVGWGQVLSSFTTTFPVPFGASSKSLFDVVTISCV